MWAFQLYDVIPDIVTMGKPLGNGHPLGAVVTTQEIAAAFDNGMEYFNTFGGNPVSAAVGNAVLDVMDGEKLQLNASKVGEHIIRLLSDVAEQDARVGDVRGRGLFLGIEIVEAGDSRRPDPKLARYLVEHAKDHGVLLSVDGPHHNVIKIKPPMVVTEADADWVVENVDDALAGISPG